MSPHHSPLPVRFALSLLLAAFCLVLSSPAQVPAPLPRIAILPDGDDRQLASLADLLTASLSQAARGCELVERAELNRLSQEAEIQHLSVADRPRALARVAKADGLILLSLEKSNPKRPSIVARLSAASSGLIHKSFMLAAEEKDIPEVAKLAAEALRFSVERLSKAGSPPPLVISLLGFRANLAGSPGVAIETTLNAALTHHLSSIAGFAVVERWKLDDLAFERTLTEKDMPPLTTGTTLVDGSFEIQDKAATVKVRIRTTQKDNGKTLIVKGPANDAFTLAKTIATKVAAECGSHAAPVPWDTRAEAAAYANLGGWLLHHRMGREAVEAYESVVALGDDSWEMLRRRIYAYLVLADPEGPFTGLPGFDARFAFSLHYSRIEANKQRFPLVLASINRATAYAELLLQKPSKPIAAFAFHGGETVFADSCAILACRTLVAAHRLKLHVQYSAEIRILRQRAEFFVKLYEKERRFFGGDPEHQVDVLAGYWSASPEQAAEYWRNLLTNPKVNTPRWLSKHRYDLTRFLDMEGFGYPPNVTIGKPIEPPRPVFVDLNCPRKRGQG